MERVVYSKKLVFEEMEISGKIELQEKIDVSENEQQKFYSFN